MKINVIDPSSTEFNRGSFCYVPYLCYNALTSIKEDVCIYETFIAEDLDTIREADINLVCLWSYPQIEAAIFLSRMLPYQSGNDNVYFIGYTPLIEHLGLSHHKEYFGFDFLSDRGFLLSAMAAYPTYYSHFKKLLLSDCDMHLKSIDTDAKVYPLFTSYGCPNGCSFCPSSENCKHNRVVLSIGATIQLLDECIEKGVRYIHFTDEDFFFSPARTYTILEHLVGKDMHLIALGEAANVQKFITTYGTDILQQSGMELIEIGFESGDADMSLTMGNGKSITACEWLAVHQHQFPFKIFWLLLTFFPGETIKTLNETGRFMQQYGFDCDDVLGRLRTNGTKGGLGQFFQPYHGLPMYPSLHDNGLFLTERPIRLIPSYIPNSFLQDKIRGVHMDRYEAAREWMDLYHVDIERHELLESKMVEDFLMHKTNQQIIDTCIALAILARMEVIT